MNYWICVTNEGNWDVVKTKHVWGVTEKHRKTLLQVKPNDILVFYVKQEWKKGGFTQPRITGIFKAISEPFLDEMRIFNPILKGGKEIFQHRVKLEPIKIPDKPLDFKRLIPKLKFIVRKDKKWGGHIIGKAMRSIPKEDYELIILACSD